MLLFDTDKPEGWEEYENLHGDEGIWDEDLNLTDLDMQEVGRNFSKTNSDGCNKRSVEHSEIWGPRQSSANVWPICTCDEGMEGPEGQRAPVHKRRADNGDQGSISQVGPACL